MPLFNPPLKVSAGTLSTNRSDITFSNASGVSFGLETNGVITATIATTYLASDVSTNFVQANAVFAGTSASGTIASDGISVSIGPYLTTAALSNHSHGNPTLALTNLSGTTASASNGLTLSLSAADAGAANPLTIQDAATTLAVTKLIFSNASGVTFGFNTAASIATLTASVKTDYLTTAALSNHSHGNPTLALTNLSGTTASASNGLTLSLSAADPGGGGGAAVGISTMGNTAGTTGFATSRMALVGSGAITLSQSTSNDGAYTITMTVPQTTLLTGVLPVQVSSAGSTISVQLVQESEFNPYANLSLVTNSTLGQSSLYFVPFDVDGAVSASRLNLFVSLTHTYSGAPNNSTAWWAMGYGLYTRMAGTGTDRMSLLTSYSLRVVSISVSSSTRLSATHYIGLSNATSHSTSQYGLNSNTVTSYMANSLAGFRCVALPLNLTLTAGRYWLGVSGQTSNQGNSAVLSASIMQQLLSNNLAFRPFGVNSAASNASFYAPGQAGSFSAQSAAWPDSIALTGGAIRAAPAAVIPYFNISGYGTSTNLI